MSVLGAIVDATAAYGNAQIGRRNQRVAEGIEEDLRYHAGRKATPALERAYAKRYAKDKHKAKIKMSILGGLAGASTGLAGGAFYDAYDYGKKMHDSSAKMGYTGSVVGALVGGAAGAGLGYRLGHRTINKELHRGNYMKYHNRK